MKKIAKIFTIVAVGTLLAAAGVGGYFVAKDMRSTSKATQTPGVVQPEDPNKPDNPDIPEEPTKPEEPKVVWNGESDTTWFDAENKQEEYTLMTAEQLAGFSDLVAAKETFEGITIKVGADMCFNKDLSNLEEAQKFMPIGSSASISFKGTFDGQSYTLENMYLAPTAANGRKLDAGLFGAAYGNISNITLKNSVVDGAKVGSIVATPGAIQIDNVHAENVDLIANSYVGGLVGGNTYLATLSVTNSSFNGNISLMAEENSASTSAIGGILGNVQYCDLAISNCETTFNATSKSTVSGLVGYMSSKSLNFTDNKVEAKVKFADDYCTYMLGRFAAPYTGLIGFSALQSESVIKNNALTAEIEANNLVAENIDKTVTFTDTNATKSPTSQFISLDGNQLNVILTNTSAEDQRVSASEWEGIYCSQPFETVNRFGMEYNVEVFVVTKDRVFRTYGMFLEGNLGNNTLQIYESNYSSLGEGSKLGYIGINGMFVDGNAKTLSLKSNIGMTLTGSTITIGSNFLQFGENFYDKISVESNDIVYL